MKNIILAGCVVFNSEGKLLLIHRNTPTRVQWELPGGKIDEGEDAETTAVRELREEVGVEVAIVQKLGEKEFHEDSYLMHYTWYEAKIQKGIPQLMEEGYDQLGYFSWEELRALGSELSGNTRNLVDAYFANELPL